VILCVNDLVYSLTHLKGLIFLLPFCLFWIWVLGKFDQGAAAWFQRPEGLAFASWIFNPELAVALFKAHPPTLSAYFLINLLVLPLFTMLAACNQLAGDAGHGYFRFLLSRCTRLEIFGARLLSASLLLICASSIIGVAATLISLNQDQRDTAEIIAYAMHINLVIPLYLLPYVLLMSLLSALFRSPAATLFAAMLLFSSIKFASFILQMRWPGVDLLSWLLPGGTAAMLVDPSAGKQALALAVLPAYACGYGLLALLAFRRRDL